MDYRSKVTRQDSSCTHIHTHRHTRNYSWYQNVSPHIDTKSIQVSNASTTRYEGQEALGAFRSGLKWFINEILKYHQHFVNNLTNYCILHSDLSSHSPARVSTISNGEETDTVFPCVQDNREDSLGLKICNQYYYKIRTKSIQDNREDSLGLKICNQYYYKIRTKSNLIKRQDYVYS